MQWKISTKQSLSIFAIGGVTLLVLTVFGSSGYGFSLKGALLTQSRTPQLPIAGKPPESLGTLSGASYLEQTSGRLPIRLKISSINVDADFEYVGLTKDGAMDVPKDPANVAWFSLGPRPGEVGSAVIAGHFGWKNNQAAVFDNLSRLKKGDKISVVDEKGVSTVFVVRKIQAYGEHQDASDIFSSIDEKAHLNLITCEGTWNKARKSYSDRLVVFSDKAEEKS